jgi:hypothetical protein
VTPFFTNRSSGVFCNGHGKIPSRRHRTGAPDLIRMHNIIYEKPDRIIPLSCSFGRFTKPIDYVLIKITIGRFLKKCGGKVTGSAFP